MTLREKCLGCGHPPHKVGECSERALFTKQPCECDVAKLICSCSGDEYVPSMGLAPHRSTCPASRGLVSA
jgi:hypothetical protein